MRKPKYVKKEDFHPGGEKGKLHRELGIPEGKKIPRDRLNAAARSDNPEIKRDAIRAKTMEGWRHDRSKTRKLYRHKNSPKGD